MLRSGETAPPVAPATTRTAPPLRRGLAFGVRRPPSLPRDDGLGTSATFPRRTGPRLTPKTVPVPVPGGVGGVL